MGPVAALKVVVTTACALVLKWGKKEPSYTAVTKLEDMLNHLSTDNTLLDLSALGL